jgi:hypothetical protein
MSGAPESAFRAPPADYRTGEQNHAVVTGYARHDGRPTVGENQTLTIARLSGKIQREGLPPLLTRRFGSGPPTIAGSGSHLRRVRLSRRHRHSTVSLRRTGVLLP